MKLRIQNSVTICIYDLFVKYCQKNDFFDHNADYDHYVINTTLYKINHIE